MLTYNFENIGSDSLYEFLYKCIKNDIIQGIILSGEKLPSKRALAKNLAISVITVENAYGQLLAEGYIYSIPKSGYYVSDLSGIPVHQTEYTSETYEAEEQGTDSRTAKAGDKVLLTGGENAFIADFTSNQTEHAAFPFSIWNKTMRAVMNDYQKEMMINPPCGCKTGTDHYRSRNRVSVQYSDPASWEKCLLWSGESGLSKDCKNLPQYGCKV